MDKELEKKFHEELVDPDTGFIYDSMSLEAIKAFIDEHYLSKKDVENNYISREEGSYRLYTREQILELIGEDQNDEDDSYEFGYNQAKREIRNKLK